MDVRAIEKLKRLICNELEEISGKKTLAQGDIEQLYKMTDIVKNLDKIQMLEGGDYSEAGNWRADIRGDYGDVSYRGRKRDSMGRYTRTGGYSRNEGSMYSMDGELMDRLEEKMHNAKSEREREAIRRCMDAMREVA